MDPARFLTIAKWIRSERDRGAIASFSPDYRDALIRTGIDRAYYSAMLKTRSTIAECLCDCDRSSFARISNMKTIIHETIVRMLETLDPGLSSAMVFLRDMRNIASYEMDEDIKDKFLTNTVDDADFIVKCQEDIAKELKECYSISRLKTGWVLRIEEEIRLRRSS